MIVIAKSRNEKNHNIPLVFEIGCEIATNLDIPNALKNPNKWIIPCMPINMVRTIRIFIYFILILFMSYNKMLNKYPEMMMQSVTTLKKMAISFNVMTFFKSIASGKERPTTPIINAIAVPKGIPLATNT